MNMGSLGVGIREPQNNNVFNPFDPNSFESLPKPQTDFNRAPGAPVRTQPAKSGPGAVNFLQKPPGSITKPSLYYHGPNQQQSYLYNQQNAYPSSISNNYNQSNYNSSGSQHSSQTSSPADFRRQREQVIFRNQYERAQASVRAQQENIQQLQLLQALYVKTQMQTQTQGMSAQNRVEFQKYIQQQYAASSAAISSNTHEQSAKRPNSSVFSLRPEFPLRASVFQEKINKHVGECLIIFNALKRDLDFNIYKENLTSDEIYGELLNCVLPHLLSGYYQYPVPSDLSCKVFNAIQNCREAEEKDAVYRNDISMKYLCDALDMLSNQLHAVRNHLLSIKSSY